MSKYFIILLSLLLFSCGDYIAKPDYEAEKAARNDNDVTENRDRENPDSADSNNVISDTENQTDDNSSVDNHDQAHQELDSDQIIHDSDSELSENDQIQVDNDSETTDNDLIQVDSDGELPDSETPDEISVLTPSNGFVSKGSQSVLYFDFLQFKTKGNSTELLFSFDVN